MTTFQINGHPVGLIRKGSGQPVLLLHSHGANALQWRALIESLCTRFTMLALDLYGHGGTAPWPGRREFTFADEAAQVCALLDTLDEPAHVVGHSYGAATALHMARLRADGLRSLTLIEPVAFHLLRDGDDADRLALDEFTAVCNTMTHIVESGDPLAAYGHFVDYWNGPGAWASLTAAKREAMARSLPAVSLAFRPTTADPARIADFTAIRVPSLLMQGTRTRLPARRTCERLAKAWPHARRQLIAGAGHMSPISHSDEVNAVIAGHLLAHGGAHAQV